MKFLDQHTVYENLAEILKLRVNKVMKLEKKGGHFFSIPAAFLDSFAETVSLIK